MKSTSLHRRNKRGSRKSALAASFVVTFAAHGVAGCKKQPAQQQVDVTDAGRPKKPSRSIYRDPHGDCRLAYDVSCPEGATCNPPPPMTIDCPPDMRDAGDPPAVTRRPPGKEDWLRVTPQLWPMTDTTCRYQPERFCAPPEKSDECTPWVQSVTIPCTKGDAGTLKVESFVYKDGLGECRKVPAAECTPSRGRRCDLPDGEVVPCP